MFSISKDFAFSASHKLDGLAEDHPCSRLHGHNYIVRLTIRSEDLNPVGFVYDYRNLDKFKQWIDDVVDHKDLNEVMFNEGIETNPTAEMMARWFRAVALELLDIPLGMKVAVSVSETPKTWATYEVTR